MNISDYVDKSHEVIWLQFDNWRRNNGVGDDPQDMKSWWECFIAGATAMYLWKIRKF